MQVSVVWNFHGLDFELVVKKLVQRSVLSKSYEAKKYMLPSATFTFRWTVENLLY